MDRLHFVERAAGTESSRHPRIVLLHGIGGSARSCGPVANRLAARGISSWCLDAPGYGESADPRPGDDIVSDVIELVCALSPDRPVVLMGTSWGGVVATAVALRRPDMIAGLILADSTRGSGTTRAQSDAMLSRVDELNTLGAHAVAAQRAPRLTAPAADPAVVDAVRRSMADLRPAGFRAAAAFMAATDHGPELVKISCPTTVLVGEYDLVTGVEESRLLADAITGARLHVIADAGHVAIQEQPDAVAELVADFVRRLP
nr:alpha/beta hydrolase [Williamsia soli]